MKIFKTPKQGTELPLMDIKGKDYLQVAHRLVWFREDHPDWQIITKPIEINTEKRYAVFRAIIKDEQGRTIATASKAESAHGFNDYLEKSETGSIGRALALCGYGTQFAPEFDEGQRLADSPTKPARKSQTLKEQYVARISIAKRAGQMDEVKRLADEYKEKVSTTSQAA